MDRPIPSAAETATPVAKDMSHHYSDLAKAQKPSSMKMFYKFFQIPGIGNLAGGSYNPTLVSFA